MIDYKHLKEYLEKEPSLYIDNDVFNTFKRCLEYFERNIYLRITPNSVLELEYIINDEYKIILAFNSLFDKNKIKAFKIRIFSNKKLLLYKDDLGQIAKSIKIYSKVKIKDYNLIIQDEELAIKSFCKIINFFK